MPPGGVGVVSAGPGLGTSVLLVRVHDAHDGAVGAADEEESTRHNDEDGPRNHGLPLPVAVAAAPVVVQPHAAHGLEAHERAQQGADQTDEATEDGDRGGDDVGGQRDGAGETEPHNPVLGGVVVQVVGAAKGADEEVLGGDLQFVSTGFLCAIKRWKLT
jgi:hypothetical protein